MPQRRRKVLLHSELFSHEVEKCSSISLFPWFFDTILMLSSVSCPLPLVYRYCESVASHGFLPFLCIWKPHPAKLKWEQDKKKILGNKDIFVSFLRLIEHEMTFTIIRVTESMKKERFFTDSNKKVFLRTFSFFESIKIRDMTERKKNLMLTKGKIRKFVVMWYFIFVSSNGNSW